MSETDSFIQEVTEEVRQDQMLRYWKKYGAYVIGAVVLIVAGAAFWNWSISQKQANAEALGAAFLAADPTDPDEHLSLAGQVDGPASVVADLAAAASLAEAGRYEEAAVLYGEVAGNAELGPEYRDLAVLQQIRVASVPGNASVSIAPLDQLITADSPYRLLALELRATIHLQNGETEAAHADLNAIITDPASTPTMRQRAGALLIATGGQQAQASG
ncbi:MAG: tetratricopeptide repeat protein [Paracoccaceae bacterium]